jgi:nucleotide-binding universal stress UspA family protein
MTLVTFEGGAPFALPAVQGARADALGGIVEVTVYTVVPGQGPAPVAIRIPMLHQTAKLLADQLAKAAIEAEVQDIRGD